MKIIRYNGIYDITIEFQDEYKHQMDTYYGNFQIGQVKNPYDKTTFGVGYLGVGKYMAKENNKTTKIYAIWSKLICRCYDHKFQELHPAYIGCIVCKEWHNFQTFAKWYEENYFKVPNERTELDKDILIPRNKLYSPDTCLLVPQSLNLLFSRDTVDGRDLPMGILKQKHGKYVVNFTYKGNKNYCGKIKSLEEACEKYIEYKEKCLKQIAKEIREYIPPRLYDILYNYKVECEI